MDAAGGGLMLALLRSAGCSLQDLVSLRLGDLSQSTRTARFSSYSETRQTQLDRQTWNALHRYAGSLGEGTLTDPLFRDGDGAPLTVERAYGMLLQYAAQVGMEEAELQRLL